jgi:hypothetical protein
VPLGPGRQGLILAGAHTLPHVLDTDISGSSKQTHPSSSDSLDPLSSRLRRSFSLRLRLLRLLSSSESLEDSDLTRLCFRREPPRESSESSEQRLRLLRGLGELSDSYFELRPIAKV